MKQEQSIPAAVGILKTGGAKFPPLLIHALPPDEKIPRILQGGAGVDERLFVRFLAGWMYRALFGRPLPGIAYTQAGAPYIPARTNAPDVSLTAENAGTPQGAEKTDAEWMGTLPCPSEAFSVSFSHTKGYVCVAFALPVPSYARGEAARTDDDAPLIGERGKCAGENPEKDPASTSANVGGACADKADSRSPRMPEENRGGRKSTRMFAGAAVGVDIERADALSDPERQKKLAERFLRRVPASPPDSTHPIAVMGCRWDPVTERPVPLVPTASVGACLYTPSEYSKQLFTYYKKTLPFAGIEAKKHCQGTNRKPGNLSSGTGKTESEETPAAKQEEENAENSSDFTVRFTALEATLKAAGGGFGSYPKVEEWMRKTARYTASLTFPDAQLALTLALAPEDAETGENA